MFYFYLVASAVLIPLTNIFFNVFKQSYSWWLVPVLYVGFLLALLIIHALVFIISISLVNVNKPVKSSGYYHALIISTIRLVLKLARVHVYATGEDKVPDDKRLLFVCNHLSDYDPLIMLSVLPQLEIGFIAKKEIYENRKFIAKVMHKLCCLPIDRDNNREAAKTIINAINLLKQDVCSVAIFPEGYVSKSGEFLPFRNGAFKIAIKAASPVVVSAISDTKPITKNMFRRRTDVYFDILGVIEAEKVTEMNTSELGDIIHEQISGGIEAIEKKTK